jgi:hypothetical protein
LRISRCNLGFSIDRERPICYSRYTLWKEAVSAGILLFAGMGRSWMTHAVMLACPRANHAYEKRGFNAYFDHGLAS